MLKTICHISIYLMAAILITICIYIAIKKTRGVLDLIAVIIIAIMLTTDISMLIVLGATILTLSI